MEIECPNCKKKVTVNQQYLYHAGWSNQGFLYCNQDTTLLLFSAYDPVYVKLVGEIHPWLLDYKQKRKVEKHLILCPCGGSFLFGNSPRCPHCGSSLQPALPSQLHYVVLGSVIDGEKENIWI